MKINLPEDVSTIIDKLYENGFEAFAVGGCVRDTILGRNPSDWDITTSAKPEDVKELFSHTIDTGIQHGTVTVMIGKNGYEVTTYRIDGEYEDARHPKEVIFTSNLVEDLKRRDFTINAMAYNDKVGIVDEFDGIGDLEKGIIRCVGNPIDRFTEDALRMLRAVRFAAALGFEIDQDTKDAAAKLHENLAKVSAERIQVEMVKLLISDHPEHLRSLYELGLSKVFLPEFDKMMECEQHSVHHSYTVGEHTIRSVMAIRKDKVLRIAMLLHDVAKPDCLKTDENGEDHFHGHPELGEKMAKDILKRLKFDNDTIKKVCLLVRFHDERAEYSDHYVRKLTSRVGIDMMPALFEVKRADVMAQSDYLRKEKLEYIDKCQEYYNIIIADNICVSKGMLAVNGKDLIDYGIEPGKEMGLIIDRLFGVVLKHPEYNEKDRLLGLINGLKD